MRTISTIESTPYLTIAETILMLGQSSSSDPASGTTEGKRIINSRFGKVEVDPGKSIHFVRGLLGIPDRYRFSLVNFPSEKMRQFMLMQSLEEDALSFITLPLPLDNGVIATDDIKAAYEELQIKPENLAILAIVSVHRSPSEVRLSINARAPLFVDAERRVGMQYVFHNDRYQIQHML